MIAQSRYGIARGILDRTLDRIDRLPGSKSRQETAGNWRRLKRLKAACLYGLAEIARMRAEYEAAADVYRQALAIYEKVFGLEHPDSVTLRAQLEELQHRPT